MYPIISPLAMMLEVRINSTPNLLNLESKVVTARETNVVAQISVTAKKVG
jgi:hypothetical protein